MLLLLDLLFAEVVLQTVDALTPEPAVLLHPVGDVPQWRRIETARPPLRTATARDQAGALQHLEVLGHRRRGPLERRGEVPYRSLGPGRALPNTPRGPVR